MKTEFNVLITSISKKVPLIKAVKNALSNLDIKGAVFGADSSGKCIGRYFVDAFWQNPLQENMSIDILLTYCLQNKIKAIIPTRDAELPFYALYSSVLKENGIACMVSNQSAIDICRDKLLFSTFLLKNGFPGIKTKTSLEGFSYHSYAVKERFGAGARSIGLNLSYLEACEWAKKLEHPIFQPYIPGTEYTIDLYRDRLGIVKGVVARKRELVVEGESQITSTVSYPQLEKICAQGADSIGLYGHGNFQIIVDHEGNSHILECNPRFGGASTLSVAAGLKSFEWFLLETLQQPLPPFVRSTNEKRQIRHAEDMIVNV